MNGIHFSSNTHVACICVLCNLNSNIVRDKDHNTRALNTNPFPCRMKHGLYSNRLSTEKFWKIRARRERYESNRLHSPPLFFLFRTSVKSNRLLSVCCLSLSLFDVHIQNENQLRTLPRNWWRLQVCVRCVYKRLAVSTVAAVLQSFARLPARRII